MRLPRVRFTVRRMMVAVVVAGAISGITVRVARWYVRPIPDWVWTKTNRLPIVDPIPGDPFPQLCEPTHQAAVLSDGKAIMDIRLERTPCFGKCPVDAVALRADGTACYIGMNFVERLGHYHGTIPKGRYARIAKLLEEKDFFGLKDSYSHEVSCLPSHITSATQSGERKRVDDYGGAGPDGLREIEKAILDVAWEIKWDARD